MVCDVIQKESGLSASFEMLLNEKVFATAQLKNNFYYGGSWKIYVNSVLTYEMHYYAKEQFKNINKPLEHKMFNYYNIINSDKEPVGFICKKKTSGNVFKRFNYYELYLNNKAYQLYMIGMGKEGFKFPIYQNDRQVALIEKECTVYNNLDEYHITFIDDYNIRISACLLSLYLDALMFGNRGEKVFSSIEKNFSITINKALKSKYNPEFKTKFDNGTM